MKAWFAALPLIVWASFCCSEQMAPTPNTITIDLNKLYVGAGVNHNRIDTSSLDSGSDGTANGFQVFGGYELGERSGLDLSAEGGYIQSDDFYSGSNIDANGFWGALVVEKALPELSYRLSALTRLGLGFKGDDGLIMGLGAQYKVHPNALLRFEYLNKDLSQSYQMNAVYKF